MSLIEELATALQAVGTLKAVGEQWISFDGSIPNGGVPFCGQIVTREMYPDLWNLMNKNGRVKTETEWQAHANANGGTCPYYSTGDGSTTFRMPNVSHYLRAGNVGEASTYKDESLPKGINLLLRFDGISSSSTGVVNRYGNDGATVSVTSGTDEYMVNQSNLSDKTKSGDLEFDPNLYKDNSDVTPKTYNVLVGVYAVGIVTNVGGTDVSNLTGAITNVQARVTELEAKPSLNSKAYIVETWINEQNWYRKWSDGWVEQGGRGGGSKALHVKMRDTNYNVSIAQNGAPDTWSTNVGSISTTNITINSAYNNPFWRVCGYAY